MDTERELPIDKWSHTRQIARVVELADTAALEVVNWEFESLLGYKYRTWLQDMSFLIEQKDRSTGRLQYNIRVSL